MASRKITGHGHRTGATHSSIIINIPPRFGIVASSVIGVTSSVTDMTWKDECTSLGKVCGLKLKDTILAPQHTHLVYIDR